MKKTTIIMLLVLGAFSLKAQDVAPLVSEGKQWNVVYSYVPWPPIHRVTDAYKVEGDTLVDGTTYKKLFTTRSEHFTNWELCGLLRETEDGLVKHREYRWNHTFGNETLLYDFSMQPGDSICYYDELAACLKLLRVNDTILEGESMSRKKYVFQYEYEGFPSSHGYETWIEGIGSEFGILGAGSRFLLGGTYDLLCYYEDDGLIWQNPLFNSCYIGTDGLDEYTPESSASVYPNPAKEKVSIEGCEVFEVMIYNGLGQLVKNLKQTKEVSVSDLPEGLYVLRITDMEGLSVTKRVTVIR